MNRFLICTGLLFAATTLLAQPKGPPKSPPAKESVSISGKTITITYNSPRVNGREGKIFTSDGLISHDPHYPVWRGGANAATTLNTDADLTIGDLQVPAGTYTLFIDISDPAQWVLIVSKKTGEWGLAYDPTQDLGRVKMHMAKPPAMVEDLKYTFGNVHGQACSLTLEWEDVSARVPIHVH